ncbi:MAG TPA: hypothetical protein VJJ28_00680 [Candidatus Paceibacterota bacterium]
MKNEGNILGYTYNLWRRLQSGQEKVIRFGKYHERFAGQIREQNGYEHQCSVLFLFTYFLIHIRPYIKLDELLLTRCASIHDVAEGISGIDLPAPSKTDNDDLKEYHIFTRLYRPLGKEMWDEMQRAFLLQFALKNPSCFPPEARRVMEDLSAKNCHEALFFDGIQRFDYLYYAYECKQERGISTLVKEVTENQFHLLENIAKELPGFSKVVWTTKVRNYFRAFLSKQEDGEGIGAIHEEATSNTDTLQHSRMELFPALQHHHD